MAEVPTPESKPEIPPSSDVVTKSESKEGPDVPTSETNTEGKDKVQSKAAKKPGSEMPPLRESMEAPLVLASESNTEGKAKVHESKASEEPAPESKPVESKAEGKPASIPEKETEAEGTASEKENKADSPVSEHKDRVKIVLLGKNGAGKSTLINNLFKFDQGVKKENLPPDPTTPGRNTSIFLKHGIIIEVVDTARQDGSKVAATAKQVSRAAEENADIILYCVPASPQSIFEDGNPAIMRELHDSFGKDLWKQCIVVLTYSNLTWDRMMKQHPKNTSFYYKEHIRGYAARFEEELKKMQLNDVQVEVKFDSQPLPVSEGHTTIVAIPAGDEPDDPVLPDFEPTKISTCAEEKPENPHEVDIKDWRDVIFFEIINKSNDELKQKLLQVKYGPTVVKVLGQAGIGAGVGAAIGAGAGAISGILLGPVGMAAGAAVGAKIGALAGSIFGALAKPFDAELPKLPKLPK